MRRTVVIIIKLTFCIHVCMYWSLYWYLCLVWCIILQFFSFLHLWNSIANLFCFIYRKLCYFAQLNFIVRIFVSEIIGDVFSSRLSRQLLFFHFFRHHFIFTSIQFSMDWSGLKWERTKAIVFNNVART